VGRRLGLVAALGIFAFYAPFLPRFFLGDDWFWLVHAQRVLADPSACFERTAYGYFRPLFVLLLGLEYRLFGLDARAFGIVNGLLHVLNCWLFWRVQVKYEVPALARNVATAIFALYFLGSPVITWISTGSDLLVLAFVLWLLLVLDDYHRAFSWGRLAAVVILGMLAATSKEVGWCSYLLVFLHAAATGRNPFRGRWAIGTAILTLVFGAYLLLYFHTRTAVDKQIHPSWSFVRNLWYLCTYLVLPISKRFVVHLPDAARTALVVIRAAVMLALPVVMFVALRRSTPRQRFLVAIPLALLAPIAAFEWKFGFFSLYPEQTASRFMYVAIPGAATLAGWCVDRWAGSVLRRQWVAVVALVVFAAGNFLAVRGVTRYYTAQQRLARASFEALSNSCHRSGTCDVIRVEPSLQVDVTQLGTAQMLSAELEMACGRKALFEVPDPLTGKQTKTPAVSDCTLQWLPGEKRFAIVQPTP
jgi:hypothetical protein